MDRKNLQQRILGMFRTSGSTRKSASKNPKTRKLGMESLEARQLLSATPLETSAALDEPLAVYSSTIQDSVASVCSGCSLVATQEAPVVEEASSFTNTMDELLRADGQDPDNLSQDYIFNLSSNPNSTYTIYLDFNGNVATNTYWNGGKDVNTPAYDTDGNGSSFSNSELRDIYEVWLRVSEDYMPFNVNVTTKEPTTDQLIKSSNGDTSYGVRVAIGGSCYDWYNSSCGGVAYVGSFDWNSDTPAFVFPKQLYTAKNVAEAVSHEAGHTLGLSHDGTSTQGYYGGADDWAPIMGVGYSQSLTQWSKGEYADANNQEDDLDKITSKGFDYRKDDYGDTFAKAASLTFSATGELGSGIIEKNTDVDMFKFTLSGEQSVITVGGITSVTNLDAKVEIYDSAKNLVATYDPSNSYYVKIDVSNFAPGDYYMSVTGTGLTVDGKTIYSDYGSLGAYTIKTELSTDSADPYEPNDTQVGAYRLGVLTEATTLSATIDPRNDDDYFNFSLGAGYTGVKITIDYEYAQSSAVLSAQFGVGGEWEQAFSDGSKTFYALTSSDSLYLHIDASVYGSAIPYRVTITPLESPELTSLALSSTKAKVGLPISAVMPYDGLTATYQWYRNTADGELVAIPGAASQTYVPTNDDLGYALTVVANGYGNCYGTASATSDKVAAQTVWTVGSTADTASSSPLTLRQALASAASGDLIVFDQSLSGQTISVGSTLSVDKSITIDASALENGVTLDAGGSNRLFVVTDSDAYFSVKGLTLANAYADSDGPAICFFGSILDVDSCVVAGSLVKGASDSQLGGAVLAYNAQVTVTNSTFTNNKIEGGALSSGAAICTYLGSLSVSGSTFSNNTSSGLGGAIYANSKTTIESSIFSGNYAGAYGGAVYSDGGALAIANSLLSGNEAKTYGGGLMADDFSAYNCTVVSNKAGYYGGGFYCMSGSGYVYNSIVLQNEAQRASGADLEKASDAALYGVNNMTNFTKWTQSQGAKTYSASKPLFTDAENGDYSIPANSQAVDAGDNEYVYSTRDILGNTRVYNSTVDLGAYEYMLAPKANLLFTEKLGWQETAIVSVSPDAVVSDGAYKIDENYYLKFNFANESNVDVENSFVARVYIDDVVYKTISVQGLDADASADYTVDLGTLAAGDHSIRISVDDGNDVDESNENDNAVGIWIEVRDDDLFEPNDSLETATDLGVLLNSTELDAKAGVKKNEDWFRFSIAALGDADNYLRVDYDSVEGSAEIAAALYDSNGRLLADSVTREDGVEEISLNALTAGVYYVRVANSCAADASVPYQLSIVPPEPPKADLTQATPAGWDSPIVVSESADATTQDEAYYEGVEYYANFCITNDSPSPANETFYVSAYLDDVLVATYTVKGLGAHVNKSYSVSLGSLTVGSHMVKIDVDTTNAVEESSETNNTFTQTFNVKGVDDKFEPNDTLETAYNLGSLVEQQSYKLYAGSSQNEDWFRFSLPEPGTSAGRVVLTYQQVSEQSDVDLYLYDSEGNQIAYSNRATGSETISLNGLAAGVYYVKAFNCCNVENSVPYEITFYPATVAKPNLKETALSTWDASILVANSASSASDAPVCFEGMNYYVRFAFTNDSACAIENAFTVKCYVDDALAKTYEVESMLVGANKSYSFSLGSLDMGVHTIRVELDTDNTVEESNELDNVYAKTIVVVSGEDEFEPNDTFETAFDLGTLAGRSNYSLNAEREQDEDWFKFTTVSQGEEGDSVSLTYEQVASSADVDLYLYDASGALLSSSRLNTGVETVSLAGLEPGTYYIRTLNYFDKPTTVPYELQIDAPIYKTETPTLSVVSDAPLSAVATIGAVDGALGYTLQYSTDAEFADAVTVTYAQAGDKEIAGLESGTTYYFRVQAYSGALPVSAWSQAVSATTPFVVPLAAPSVSVATTKTALVLKIGAVDDAANYLVQYSSDPSFASYSERTYSAGVRTIAKLDSNVLYYYRVKAVAPESTETTVYVDSEWTEGAARTKAALLAAPEVSAVANGATAIDVTVGEVADAAEYVVEYAAAEDFSDAKSFTVTAAGTTSVYGLAPETTYFVRAYAAAKGYVNSDYGTASATTDPAVQLDAPAYRTTATKTAIVFKIDAVENAAAYRVQCSLNSDFSDAVERTYTASGVRTIPGLASGTSYYCRVQAVAPLGGAYVDSEAVETVVATKADHLDAPTLQASSSGLDSIDLTISAVSSATSYKYEYSTSEDFADSQSGVVSAAGVVTISGLESGTTYYFRAVASAYNYEDSDYGYAVETTDYDVQLDAPTVSTSTTRSAVVFNIGAVENGEEYVVEYSTDPNFETSATRTFRAGVRTIANLESDATYYCRVKAVADKYFDSAWTNVVATTKTNVLDAPTLNVAAADEDGVVELTIAANGVASAYTVECSASEDFADAASYEFESAGSYAIAMPDAESSMYIRVKAHADTYVDSAWTGICYDGEGDDGRKVFPSISVISTSKSTIDVRIGSLKNALVYWVQYSTKKTFEDSTTISVQPGKTTVKNLTPNTMYFFRSSATMKDGTITQYSGTVFATTFFGAANDAESEEDLLDGDDELFETLAMSLLD